jgi:hypothetical protein
MPFHILQIRKYSMEFRPWNSIFSPIQYIDLIAFIFIICDANNQLNIENKLGSNFSTSVIDFSKLNDTVQGLITLI